LLRSQQLSLITNGQEIDRDVVRENQSKLRKRATEIIIIRLIRTPKELNDTCILMSLVYLKSDFQYLKNAQPSGVKFETLVRSEANRRLWSRQWLAVYPLVLLR
jgi:hypothetical protein